MKKVSTFVLFVILCSVWVTSLNIEAVKAQSKTIVVPDDFATIQEAINNATKGDTVFIKSGVYHDLALINKSISFIGENKDTTIIDSIGIESRVYIEANDVTVTGFTIKNADSHGIRLGLIHFEADSIYQPVRCKIVGNNLINNFEGINVQGGEEHIISENNITGSRSHGIIVSSSKSIISKNNISNNLESGIIVDSCSKVIIKGNKINVNGFGLILRWDGSFYVYGNNITDNRAGIQFGEGCNNSSISKNNVIRNEIGVEFLNFQTQNHSIGSGNLVYSNNFIDNSKQVLVNKEHVLSEKNGFNVSNGTDIVSWNKGKLGNYWNNYKGTDINADGIWDQPYIIDENNQDNHPFKSSLETPKFQSQIMNIDEATLAVNIDINAEFYIGARKIAEPVGEPYLQESEVTGYLMWLVPNGTIYQAEYPSGKILGEYLLTHKPYWDNQEGSYIWNLNYGNAETYWVEAKNGTILQHTPFIFEETSKQPSGLDRLTFQWSTESVMLFALLIIATTGAALIFFIKLRKTSKKTN